MKCFIWWYEPSCAVGKDELNFNLGNLGRHKGALSNKPFELWRSLKSRGSWLWKVGCLAAQWEWESWRAWLELCICSVCWNFCFMLLTCPCCNPLPQCSTSFCNITGYSLHMSFFIWVQRCFEVIIQRQVLWANLDHSIFCVGLSNVFVTTQRKTIKQEKVWEFMLHILALKVHGDQWSSVPQNSSALNYNETILVSNLLIWSHAVWIFFCLIFL